MREPGRFPVALVSLMGLLISGCSSSWVPSDLHPEDRLSDIGSSGYRRICSSYRDAIHERYDDAKLRELVCIAYGVETSDSVTACRERAERCLDRMPDRAEDRLEDVLEQAHCNRLNLSVSGCRVTVAELVTCLDELELGLTQVGFDQTCQDVGAPFDDRWWRVPLPQSCQEVRDRC